MTTKSIYDEMYSFDRTACFPPTPRLATVDLPVVEPTDEVVAIVNADEGGASTDGLLLYAEDC